MGWSLVYKSVIFGVDAGIIAWVGAGINYIG